MPLLLKPKFKQRLFALIYLVWWLWYWQSRRTSRIELKGSEGALSGGWTQWRKIATGCEISYDLPSSDSKCKLLCGVCVLGLRGGGVGGWGYWYRTRPMSQNTHLTLKGNLRNHSFCFCRMTNLGLWGWSWSPSPPLFNGASSLCSLQEV